MRYNIERACIEMSVRELCEMAYAGGDLDLRPGTGGGRPSFLRAVLGAKIHRKLQAAAGAGYQAEVTMTHTEQFRGIIFEVEGRADGVMARDPYIVDEIKQIKHACQGHNLKVIIETCLLTEEEKITFFAVSNKMKERLPERVINVDERIGKTYQTI
mgnify:CR=1 FL=1